MNRRVRFLVVVFTFVAAGALLRADWTGVAATGTIDEGDVGKVVMNSDGSAMIRSTISSTSAIIRYNVVAVAGLEPPAPGTISGGLVFSMRALDNGSGASVLATLKRVTLAGFSFTVLPQRTEVLATINSDLAPASTSWQTIWATGGGSCNACFGDNGGLRFLDYGYVVEVELIKHDSTGTPGIMGVQLFRDET